MRHELNMSNIKIWNHINNYQAWESYISSHSLVQPYHHPDWLNLLEAVYGFSTAHIISLDDNGEIIGLLPTFYGRSLNGRLKIRSIPFSHFSPPLANSAAITAELLDGLEKQARQLKADTIVINAPLSVHNSTGWRELGGRWESILHLQNRNNTKKMASSCLRNARKAQRNGIVIRQCFSEEEYEHFKKLMVITRRRQGAPPYPAKLYPALQQLTLARLYMAFKDDVSVAGIILLVWQDKAIYMYGASSDSGRSYGANDLLFLTLIDSLTQEGLKQLNFGATPERQADLLRFKNKWGCISSPLAYSINYLGSKQQDLQDIIDTRAEEMLGIVINHTPAFFLQWLGNRFFRYLGWY